MRGSSRFTASDISRALRGARAAGRSVVKIEIDCEGKLSMVFDRDGKSGEPVAEPNEWDAEFNGKDQAQVR
jgi:hypothetical protein